MTAPRRLVRPTDHAVLALEPADVPKFWRVVSVEPGQAPGVFLPEEFLLGGVFPQSALLRWVRGEWTTTVLATRRLTA